MSLNSDLAKGKLVSVENVNSLKFTKSWKLNAEDVVIKTMMYYNGSAGGTPGYRLDSYSLTSLSNSENSFDDKIETYATLLLKSVDAGEYKGVAAAYLNVPLEISVIEVFVGNEVNPDTANGPILYVSYLDGTNVGLSPSTISTYSIFNSDTGADEVLSVYEYSLDNTKKLQSFGYFSDATGKPSWGGDIHGFYAYVVQSDSTSYEVVGLKDTSDTRIDPATSTKQDDAISHISNIDSKVATNSNLTTLRSEVAKETKQDSMITDLDGIKSQTDKLTFDTSNLLKVNVAAGGAGYEVVGLKDSSDTRIDPATSGKQDTAISTLGDIKTNTTGLSTEGTLSSVLSQLDIKTSELRDGLEGSGNKTMTDIVSELSSILSQLDVALSTRASETTVSSILSKLDITLSSLRDAITGTGANNTLTDLYNELSSLLLRIQKDSQLYYTEQGRSFVSPGYFTSLSNGSKKYFLFDLSSMSGLEAIMEILGVSLQAEAVCRIYKSPSISANGTSLPITNTNMASSTTSNMKTYEDPTISSNGTKIFEVYLPGATTGGFFSSPYGLSAVVLKDMKLSGKVLVEIENVSGSTMDYGTLVVRWRER